MKIPEWVNQEFLDHYRKHVDEVIQSRVRIVAVIGMVLHLLFYYFDLLLYPEHSGLFLKIRLVNTIFVLLIFFPTFLKKSAWFAVWAGDIGVSALSAGVCLMIYLSNGSMSQYHEGICLTIFGLLIINSFLIWHIIGTSLLILTLYTIAVLSNTTHFNLDKFLFANFFMVSTAFFAVVLTKLYSDQHFKIFLRNKEIKMSEEKLAQTNAKLEQMYQFASEQSKRDLLTGLYNNATYKELFRKEFSHAKRYKTPLSLLFIDLDYFKDINDNYGHQMGDWVLQAVGKTLQETCRDSDIPVRFGGDEMAIILPGITRQQALPAAERLKQKINQISFKEQGGPENVQSSIGLAEVLPKDATAEAFMERVDKALYLAKQGGRNRIIQWDEELSSTRPDYKGPRVSHRHNPPDALKALQAIVRAHDLSRHWGSSSLQELLFAIADKCSVSAKGKKDLEMAFLLRDIGHISLPDIILLKTGKLDESEKMVIKTHTRAGRDLILDISPELADIAEAVYSHHERWDGEGYPDGLKGEAIPLIARIVSILDVYNAMTSERPYRIAVSHAQAVEEIQRQAGKQFDPHLVEVFLDVLREQPNQQSQAA